MKRLLAILIVGLLLGAAAVLSHQTSPPEKHAGPTDLQLAQEERNPWNHLQFNKDKETFRFAIVSDRTGGARPGIFERAVEQLNWMQPEFVVSVGDLIQEGGQDPETIKKRWQEFNGFVAKLEMPFFYLPGNNDIGNKVQEKKWRELFGRRYYHFVYQNVLFLMLNTEDVPGASGAGQLSQAQVAYFQKVLKENARVRWTLVFLHRPVWTYPELARTRWPQIEKALADRPYTVFAGHKHHYERFLRNGKRYYMLGTTGGSSLLRGVSHGEFDHIVWVTMKKEGPVLANLMMDGIYPDDPKIDWKKAP
jgi:3',5'-cyclic AMP phosphodiesterase CpdA